ncbi:hypothetical protein AC230_01885 [Streptomyces caatingaensis]|uniref:Sugar kinase n=1 Tax=Streptomyces caatingaensis TaxID=1678637 RepID=A0A0K9XLR8_9ACTN|nr:hypothetical protein AC230_01885 [Streptomyces caatingaensis]
MTVEHTERETAPEEAPAPAGPKRRRWLKPVIVFLLIAIPAGYLYISAMQSRNGSGTKQEQAAATGLEEGWPSRLQRRIYEVTVAPYAEDVAHFETNSWKSSSLYLQFTTTRDRLGPWLAEHGLSPSDFEDGDITIDEDEAAQVGWRFGEGHHWTGAVREEDKPKPSLEVVVNLDDPNRPRVFVVSTTTP